MEQTPNVGFVYHLRMLTTLSVLAYIDVSMVLHARGTLLAGPSAYLLFGFEARSIDMMLMTTHARSMRSSASASWGRL